MFGSGCYSRACLGIDGALASSLWSLLAISVAATAAWWIRGWPSGTQGYLLAATLCFSRPGHGIVTWVWPATILLRPAVDPRGAALPGLTSPSIRASGETPMMSISWSDIRRQERKSEKKPPSQESAPCTKRRDSPSEGAVRVLFCFNHPKTRLRAPLQHSSQ